MTYTSAKALCESDGAFLAVPRSDAENDFITWLFPGSHVWIGINDINQEGVYVSVDGRSISYTKWYSGEPNNSGDEDGVHIHADWNGYWNDKDVSNAYKFVCIYSVNHL